MLEGMTQLKQRFIMSGTVTIIALLTIFLAPIPAFKPILTAIIAGSIGVAIWELYQIASAKQTKPAKTLGIFFGAFYVVSVAIATQYPAAHMLPEITLLVALLVCSLYYFVKGDSPFVNLSVTLLGLIYIAVPLSCMIRVVYFFGETGLQDGRWWFLYLIAVSKMTDTGGFFIGKRFGRQKLAPYISPKKTWEGAIGGLSLAVLTSVAIMLFTTAFNSAFHLTFWQSICLGVLVGIMAQCGDLIESLFKRDGGIKDSNQLPGLGGMLDIVDSLVFTSPLIYLFLEIYA